MKQRTYRAGAYHTADEANIREREKKPKRIQHIQEDIPRARPEHLFLSQSTTPQPLFDSISKDNRSTIRLSRQHVLRNHDITIFKQIPHQTPHSRLFFFLDMHTLNWLNSPSPPLPGPLQFLGLKLEASSFRIRYKQHHHHTSRLPHLSIRRFGPFRAVAMVYCTRSNTSHSHT